MEYPKRDFTKTIEDSLSENERRSADDEKQRIHNRVKSHASVHTLLIDAKEAIEKWNSAKVQIQAGRLDSTTMPPRALLVAACYNYYLCLDEINSRDQERANRESETFQREKTRADEADRRANRQFIISVAAITVSILSLLITALTFIGLGTRAR
jgi:hypothetical protein